MVIVNNFLKFGCRLKNSEVFKTEQKLYKFFITGEILPLSLP